MVYPAIRSELEAGFLSMVWVILGMSRRLLRVRGGRMMGVGVMMEGVLDGTGDKTGRGCGAMPQTSQEVRRSAHIAKLIVFLIVLL